MNCSSKQPGRQMAIIETARLLIRPFVIEDLDELYHLYTMEELMQYVDGDVRSRDGTKKYLQNYIADYERYGFGLCAAILRSTGQMIGRCGLIPTPTKAGIEGELAIMFKKECWGLGLATEVGRAIVRYAFDKMQLARIFAKVNRDNVASIRVSQKLGMHCVRSSTTDVEYEIRRLE